MGHRGTIIGRVIGAAGILLAGSSFMAPVHAFQQTKIESIFCGVVTGGTLPPAATGFHISHIPLQQGSAVTRDVLIVGEVGFETPPTPPPFSDRLTPTSITPGPGFNMRSYVIYETFPPTTPGGPSGQHVRASEVPTVTSTTPFVYGADPLAFAFQLDPSFVSNGLLRYRIIAEKLEYNPATSSFTIVGSTAFPPNGDWIGMGVQANASQVFGPSGGRFVLADGNPEDGETSLDIPAGLLQTPTQITIDEIPADSPFIPGGLDRPIRVYRLESNPPVRGGMQLSLLYPDFEYPVGQDGQVDGMNLAENQIGIVWWDGFKWRRLGGRSNANANTLSVKIGFFNFMAIVPAAPITAAERRPPQKIITPNGDASNEAAEFTFGDLTETVRVEIFDVTGHRVRTISSNGSASWDGRDDDGSVVESGVYIYQYSVGGERISGVVAVAK